MNPPSLLDIAFSKLPRNEKLKYIYKERQGLVNPIDRRVNPIFLTPDEYIRHRVQQNRDKYPEMYADIPRLEGTGTKINYSAIDWGSLTKQFKKSKIPKVKNLKQFAEYVEDHPTKFHSKTLKRARFYTNVIDGKGIESGSESDSDDSDSDEEGSGLSKRKNMKDLGKLKSSSKYMGNPWIEFVKQFASHHNIKYSDAVKNPKCKEAYHHHKLGKGMESSGDMSKTHKGEKDYTTKKTSKDYHRNHHLVAGNPYKTGGSMLENSIAEAYNESQLGANGGKKFISL